MKLIEKASGFRDRTALISNGQPYSYQELIDTSARIAATLLAGKADLNEERIAFLVQPSFQYTAIQWGIWRAGGIAVPLCSLHPLPSMLYVVEDTAASLIITDAANAAVASELGSLSGKEVLRIDSALKEAPVNLPSVNNSRRAMILYTSGTTSQPKGVVTRHHHIEAQIETLVQAWEWQKDDRILNVLPLHHVHGIINVMLCALWSGACCEFLPKFDPALVWERIANGGLSLFMGVPTMYYQLVNYWDSAEKKEQKKLSAVASKLRLMVSGSAALPVSVLEKWRAITGHTLLERYGMTEIGMGLSNSYRGERRPGHVGLPLPGVEIRLVNADQDNVVPGEAGEIFIKGPSVFDEYWNKPEATKDAFTNDGWFKTGDVAIYNQGSYKILGRSNVDIIKSGGYKISALEIEDILRQYEQIKDCAVVGLADEEWGEIVAAVLIADQQEIDLEGLRIWLRERLPSYKLPRRFLMRSELPRNVLGKVTKTEVKRLF